MGLQWGLHMGHMGLIEKICLGGIDKLSPRFCALVRVYDPHNALVEALDVLGSPVRNNKKPSNTFNWTLW